MATNSQEHYEGKPTLEMLRQFKADGLTHYNTRAREPHGLKYLRCVDFFVEYEGYYYKDRSPYFLRVSFATSFIREIDYSPLEAIENMEPGKVEVMEDPYVMSDEALQTAIDSAERQLCNVLTPKELKAKLMQHLEFLLDVQKARAHIGLYVKIDIEESK